jgi:hypothetical protein
MFRMLAGACKMAGCLRRKGGGTGEALEGAREQPWGEAHQRALAGIDRLYYFMQGIDF